MFFLYSFKLQAGAPVTEGKLVREANRSLLTYVPHVYMGDSLEKLSNREGLEFRLKYHLQARTKERREKREKGVREASYGEMTRKSTVNKRKVCYADLSQCLLHQ